MMSSIFLLICATSTRTLLRATFSAVVIRELVRHLLDRRFGRQTGRFAVVGLQVVSRAHLAQLVGQRVNGGLDLNIGGKLLFLGRLLLEGEHGRRAGEKPQRANERGDPSHPVVLQPLAPEYDDSGYLDVVEVRYPGLTNQRPARNAGAAFLAEARQNKSGAPLYIRAGTPPRPPQFADYVVRLVNARLTQHAE